jgi:PAS domain S-box-containing protein
MKDIAYTYSLLDYLPDLFGVYSAQKAGFLWTNKSFQEKLEEIHIIVKFEFPGVTYGRYKNIPLKMTHLKTSVEGNLLVRLVVAQSKTLVDMYPPLMELTDMSSDGIWHWYPEMDFVFMSQRFWEILGFDYSEMDETPSASRRLINEEDMGKVDRSLQAHIVSKGDVPYDVQVSYRHCDGHAVIIRSRGSVVEWLPNGKPWFIMGTHTDITDIIQKDMLKAKEQFVSRMSHEIRSPLCVIINECDFLKEEYPNHSGIASISESCQQLVNLANDILTLSKTNENEGTALNLVNANPEEILSKSMTKLRVECRKKNLKLATSITGEIPEQMQLDVLKFQQVLNNLVNNSIKYSKRGTISVVLDRDEENYLVITVSDEGIGMSEKDCLYIFEDFYQSDQSSTGAGLGLTICKKIALLMNGTIYVARSEVGVGTSIVFKFPINTMQVGEEVGPPSTKSIKVMNVDDISVNRAAIRRKVQQIEHHLDVHVGEVIDASNGIEAVELFKSHIGNFDIILMDILMPIMDGFEATRDIHKYCDEMHLPRVPVIAMTASVSETLYMDCKEAGMGCVVTKPFTVGQLYEAMHSALDVKKRALSVIETI